MRGWTLEGNEMKAWCVIWANISFIQTLHLAAALFNLFLEHKARKRHE